MRVSLYKHELEVIAHLTMQLMRLRQEVGDLAPVENVALEIFARLVDGLYSRGNYRQLRYEGEIR